MNLADAILVLVPLADPLVNFSVSDDGAGQKIVLWKTDILGAQPTADQIAAVTQAQVDVYRVQVARAAAKQLQDAVDGQSRVGRAAVELTVNEINSLRQWIMSFKIAVAAAASLSDLKSRVAALSDMTDRTYAQAKAAIQNIIDGE